MFDLYKKANFDFKHSMYVGDAMGRSQDWSDSDLRFAENCKLIPKTPEEIFPFEKKNIKITQSATQEVIILVGYPGSGKTTLTEQYEDNEQYVIIHGDELKTETKIKKALKLSLENNKSAIIDATNPTKEKRKVFIDIAKTYQVHTKIIYLSTSFEESIERNQKREKPVPKIAFYVFRKKLELPTNDEADEIIII